MRQPKHCCKNLLWWCKLKDVWQGTIFMAGLIFQRFIFLYIYLTLKY